MRQRAREYRARDATHDSAEIKQSRREERDIASTRTTVPDCQES